MDEQKRKNLPRGLKEQKLQPGLWVVATPIGNVLDLSERGRRALQDADAILCEDTRRTSKLLSVLELSKSLYRFDEHVGEVQLEKAIERLLAGDSLALVSDAGTPGISDPGARLVAAAHEAGVQITAVPGPAAVVALLSVAGFDQTAFTFRGFFPRKAAEKAREFQRIRQSQDVSQVYVWYESPERMQDTLQFIHEQAARAPAIQKMIAAKELTKIHEKLFWGSVEDVRNRVNHEISTEGRIGEWCLAIEFEDQTHLSEGQKADTETESLDWVKTLQCLLNVRVSASDAAREVSQSFGIAKKTVYERALKISGKK